MSQDVAAFEKSQQEFANETRVIQLPIESQSRWIPPEATQTVPFLPTTESVEVSIFDSETSPILKGAIALVSLPTKIALLIVQRLFPSAKLICGRELV